MMYDYLYDRYVEEVESPKETEMRSKGYDHITNFDPDNEWIYREAAKKHHLKFSIDDEAYDVYGNRVPHAKAFYVHVSFSDLSAFWRTFDQLKY